jgi:hypothetical protein
MAASRLTDSQRQELVERYRRGETAQSLAQAFGCSPNTVSRAVKTALDPEELAALKKQPRTRSASVAAAAAVEVSGDPPLPPDPVGDPAVEGDALPPSDAPVAEARDETQQGVKDEPEAHLAIDDADDFGDDGLEESLDDGDESELTGLIDSSSPGAARCVGSPRPLHSDSLPTSVYLLVDKTVELDIRPLRDFPELGGLPDEEQDRHALMLYANPRQAKRQCGRSQRVIKVPDSGVLERTSRYLVAQGITRLVLEGGDLFAIPGT